MRTSEALKYIKANLSIIPTQKDKTPAISKWKPLIKEPINKEEALGIYEPYESQVIAPLDIIYRSINNNTEPLKIFNLYGIGIICGISSNNLEVIDVDCKYDLTGNLWNEFSNMLKDNLLGTYEKLLIAETKNGGYHIYYKAENIEVSQTLAERETTSKEREEKKEKTKTIIETRGEGGYVIAPPTPGYNYIQGDVLEIPTITPEERNLIINIARSFNEIPEEKELIKYNTSVNKVNKIEGLSPFDDFNNRGEVIPLLENHGYTIVKETAERIYLKRPGKTDSKYSGNYLKSKGLLHFHSSNAYPFEQKTYNRAMVFALLECNETALTGYKETYRKLLSLGYGDAITSNKSLQVKTTNIQVSKVNRINNVNTEISHPGDTLKIDTLKNVYGDEFIINLLQVEEQEKQKEETIKAIELIKKESEIIFVTINGERLFYPWYIFGTYTEAFIKLYDTDKDRAIITLKRDVIGLLSTLKPTDKDIIKNEFLSMEVINVLGITSESLELEVEAIKKEKTEEKKLEKTKEVLDKTQELIEQGKTKEAFKNLEEGISKISGVSNENSFEDILNIPTDENSIRERASNRPDSIASGIVIDREEFKFQAGALSYLVAPTSHGKTTALINIALNVLERYKNSEVFYLSYEEDKDPLTYLFLNTFIRDEIAINGNNRESIAHYFKTGSLNTIKTLNRETFTNSKETFFNTLINSKRLNINRIHYDYTELIEFIKHIKRTRNPKAIFIDYIQIINLPAESKAYSRQGEVKDIGIALNKIAQETGLPIILGAQFNRTTQHALDLDYTKIGEAGDIERQANSIIGIWNNQFKGNAEKNKLDEIKKHPAGIVPGSNTWYIKVLKNRAGRVNIDQVISYNPNQGYIKNYEQELKYLKTEAIEGELF